MGRWVNYAVLSCFYGFSVLIVSTGLKDRVKRSIKPNHDQMNKFKQAKQSSSQKPSRLRCLHKPRRLGLKEKKRTYFPAAFADSAVEQILASPTRRNRLTSWLIFQKLEPTRRLLSPYGSRLGGIPVNFSRRLLYGLSLGLVLITPLSINRTLNPD